MTHRWTKLEKVIVKKVIVEVVVVDLYSIISLYYRCTTCYNKEKKREVPENFRKYRIKETIKISILLYWIQNMIYT